MQKHIVKYSHRDYDSRIVANEKTHRAYFGTGESHRINTQQIKNQLQEMLGWICEHMVLPTEQSHRIAEWALATDTYITKTTVPRGWDIDNARATWTDSRTGNTKHTRPCAIGVLGGMVMNSLTQSEFTELQIQGLNRLFEGMQAPGLRELWPNRWRAYEFVHKEQAQRDTAATLDQLFGA